MRRTAISTVIYKKVKVKIQMGRSNNENITNPATMFIDWNGAEGSLSHYDKVAKVDVAVALPFKFMVLEKVAQITGGADIDGKYDGYWSNAVKNTKTQKFVVKSKRGIVTQGYYDEIKGTLGCKFMTGLYIAYRGADGEMQIGYLKVKGAALTAWIELSVRNVFKGAFSITGSESKKKGSNTYFEPVFEYTEEVAEATEAQAIALDTDILQPYLKAYFGQTLDTQPNNDGFTGIDENDPSYYPLTEPEDMPDDIKDAQATNNDDIPW